MPLERSNQSTSWNTSFIRVRLIASERTQGIGLARIPASTEEIGKEMQKVSKEFWMAVQAAEQFQMPGLVSGVFMVCGDRIRNP
jgi:hypothetical protein